MRTYYFHSLCYTAEYVRGEDEMYYVSFSLCFYISERFFKFYQRTFLYTHKHTYSCIYTHTIVIRVFETYQNFNRILKTIKREQIK